jgi:hypothetical protein
MQKAMKLALVFRFAFRSNLTSHEIEPLHLCLYGCNGSRFIYYPSIVQI